MCAKRRAEIGVSMCLLTTSSKMRTVIASGRVDESMRSFVRWVRRVVEGWLWLWMWLRCLTRPLGTALVSNVLVPRKVDEEEEEEEEEEGERADRLRDSVVLTLWSNDSLEPTTINRDVIVASCTSSPCEAQDMCE